MHVTRHTAGRAMDGWSSINVPRSPNLRIDGDFSTSPGAGENYNTFRFTVPSQPSSYTLQVPSHMPYEVSQDPISRFQNQSGPWVPRGIADIPTHTDSLPRQSRSSNLWMRYSEPNTSFSQYQTKAGSELESDITGPYPSDSGYGTRSPATTSILSCDPVDHNQECSSITGPIDGLNFYPEDRSQVYAQPDKQRRAQETEHRSDRDLAQSASHRCHYVGCGAIVKCPSELRYRSLCCAFIILDAKRVVI